MSPQTGAGELATHAPTRQAGGLAGSEVAADPVEDSLPAWPISLLFAGYPIWWLLGVVDIIWVPAAALMSVYLVRSTLRTRLPRGFSLWALFLVWALFSVIEVGVSSTLIAFGYRYLIYLSCTVILVYVYNARRHLTERAVAGVMTTLWLWTVIGGYLGLLFPTFRLHTLLDRVLSVGPLSALVPTVLTGNPLFHQMVVRPLSQYNPLGYTRAAPRPSAPFLYTNNWGNAYSMLIPIVLVYLFHVWGTRKAMFLAAALAVSLVPASLTLNRGMFIGLGIATVYFAGRLLLMGNLGGVAFATLVAVVGVVALAVLPIQSRLDSRLTSNTNGSTDTRAALYTESIASIPTSPFFGHGSPKRADDPAAPPVGTQGQFWLVLYSHGLGGVVFFMGWFLTTVGFTLRRRDRAGLAWNTVMLVATVELLYYGVVPSGLPIIMVAAAMALRDPEATISSQLQRLRTPPHLPSLGDRRV